MRAVFVGESMLVNTDEVEIFIDTREPVYNFLYVCSPDFYVEGGQRYYKVHVRMYKRTEDNGRRLTAN